MGRLKRMLERRGRRREDIEVSICPYLTPATTQLVEGYEEAGVDRVILMAAGGSPRAVVSALDDLASGVVAKSSAGKAR